MVGHEGGRITFLPDAALQRLRRARSLNLDTVGVQCREHCTFEPSISRCIDK